MAVSFFCVVKHASCITIIIYSVYIAKNQHNHLQVVLYEARVKKSRNIFAQVMNYSEICLVLFFLLLSLVRLTDTMYPLYI